MPCGTQFPVPEQYPGSFVAPVVILSVLTLIPAAGYVAVHEASSAPGPSAERALAAEQELARALRDNLTRKTFEISEPRVRLCGDVAVVTAKVRTSGTLQAKPFDVMERQTDVLQWKDGGWRVVLTHCGGPR